MAVEAARLALEAAERDRNKNRDEQGAREAVTTQEQQILLSSYARPSLETIAKAIVRPDITGKFELKEGIVRLLSLFPFSLIGEAMEWLTNLPVGSIISWEVLSNKFIDMFFSPKKTKELRGRIANFTQRDSESLTHAWERYKGYLQDCSHHMQPKEIIGNYFIEGLKHESRVLLNATAQGQILNKTYEEMEALLELMSEGAYEYQETSRGLPQKAAGVLQVDDVAAMRADTSTLTNVMLRAFPQAQQIQPVQHIQQAACVSCGLPHDYSNCPLNPESIYYVGQQNRGVGNRGNYYENNYNTPFGKQDFHKPNNYQQPQAQPASNLEEMMKQIMLKHKPQGVLASDTEKNPKECEVITLRNGKALEEVPPKKKSIAEAELIPAKRAEPKQIVAEQPVEEVVRPPLPFPQRLQKQKADSACKKFLELLKQVHINIPLVELLQEVPKYAKYIKDVVENKRHWTEFETVALTEECSSRVRSKIPPKLNDLGNFTISITIGNIEVGIALCDLGASINLMPTSVFRTWGLSEPMPTTITLQLADRSLAYPDDKSVPLIMGRGFLATVDAVIRVRDGKMSMTVDGQEATFDVLKLPSFQPIMRS
ncbi:uncharacterized protein LOC132612789 [Lycium barbarum]|uniref:uncharacterized protein LOC132612789 n=1 Tax=Lycium barbarum TaxID=112863 RepID=UPI00293F028A|nr:uncharacterized protein LOC132612789 [Lycium barbarum]